MSFRNVALQTVSSKVPTPVERARFMSLQSAVQHGSSSAGAMLSTLLLTEGVTLQFRDANVKMVFEALSRTANINIILDRDVRADLRTTIYVQNASVEDTLDLLLLAPWPLELAALAKCLAHWIVTGLPLSLLAPVLGVAFGLDGQSLLALGATLLVGTPTLSLIGGLAAALTLGARKSGALLALLALPLCVPTLIFGAGAIETLAAGEGIVTHVAILAALALVALATTPWAIAAALRQAGE